MGVRDGQQIGDTEIRIRGEAERLGPVVPRGFLTAFTVPGAPTVNPAQSGRLELAEWLTSPNNPLTPRVIVNRVWHHLFGQGIVTTVDNFGVTGDTPSHPELLDYLARRFVRDGWSVKSLVRTLVLSRTYRLGSELRRLTGISILQTVCCGGMRPGGWMPRRCAMPCLPPRAGCASTLHKRPSPIN